MRHAAGTARRSARLIRAAALSGAGLMLAACAVSVQTGSGSGGPNAFYAQLSQNGLAGSYDPAGFAEAEIRRLLGEVCAHPAALTDYAERQGADGRMAFSARCRGGSEYLFGTVSYHRLGNRVWIETPGHPELYSGYRTEWSVTL